MSNVIMRSQELFSRTETQLIAFARIWDARYPQSGLGIVLCVEPTKETVHALETK